MAVLHGALDVGDEWRIVKNKDTSDIKPAERAFLMNFEKTSASGSLICAMGAINHYTINHMTGQGKLQGFALKVAKALNLGSSLRQQRTRETILQRCFTLQPIRCPSAIWHIHLT